MAGDWIKMRADLFTHPKVVRISSAFKVDVLRTVGGLMSVWCLFDAHSVDGKLEGYDRSSLDDHVRWPGFSDALIGIGWLEQDAGTLVLPRFESHNGQSAKRRAQDAERKKQDRKMSASDADKKRTREEKRREEIKPPKSPKGEPEGFAEFYAAYPRHEARAKAAQAFAKVNTPLKTLLDAIAAHKKTEQWTKSGGEFIPLPASWLNGKRWEDEIAVPTASAAADPDTRASIEAEGRAKGMGPWDELKEPFQAYKARVRAPAPKQDPAIAAMVAGAFTRRGIPA